MVTTTYYSLLTTHYLLLTTYYSLLTYQVRGQPDALALGSITRWQREDAEAGDGALFHCAPPCNRRWRGL